MNVVQTDPNGVVNKNTVFEFEQSGSMVSSKYSGGRIQKGYLIGLVKDDTLEFRFTQLQDDNILDGGYSKCKIEILNDGRIRLIEKFEWESREGIGENIFEEIKTKT